MVECKNGDTKCSISIKITRAQISGITRSAITTKVFLWNRSYDTT